MSDATQFEALPQRQISDAVYDVLRQKILACQLLPGQRLVVEQISSQLRVSRTPVKDALGRLAAKGLVKIQPRRGTFVTQLGPKDIRENLEVREALELKACELLEGKIAGDKIQKLRDLNDRLTSPDVSLAENAELDGEFHRLLVEYSDNTRLLDVYTQLDAHLQIARIHYRSDNWRSRLPLARQEHAAVIEALETNRIAEAKSLLQRHIRASMNRMISDMMGSATAS